MYYKITHKTLICKPGVSSGQLPEFNSVIQMASHPYTDAVYEPMSSVWRPMTRLAAQAVSWHSAASAYSYTHSEKVLMSEMDMLLNATGATKLRYAYFAPLPSLPLPLYIQPIVS